MRTLLALLQPFRAPDRGKKKDRKRMESVYAEETSQKREVVAWTRIA